MESLQEAILSRTRVTVDNIITRLEQHPEEGFEPLLIYVTNQLEAAIFSGFGHLLETEPGKDLLAFTMKQAARALQAVAVILITDSNQWSLEDIDPADYGFDSVEAFGEHFKSLSPEERTKLVQPTEVIMAFIDVMGNLVHIMQPYTRLPSGQIARGELTETASAENTTLTSRFQVFATPESN